MRAQGTLLLCLLMLAGCKLKLPAVDGGSFVRHAMVDHREQVTTGRLTESQVKALVDWLRSHETGWEHRIEDFWSGMSINLSRGGVSVAVVNIRENEVWAKDLVRPITPDERATLLAIVEPPESP